jgi:Domain of unknown function (DUF4437)
MPMNRPLVDFIHTDGLTPVSCLIAGWSAPVRCRTLSMDPHTGGSSAVVDIPEAWTAPPARLTAGIELMVLEGALRLGDRELARSGYLYVPSGGVLPRLQTDGATRLVVFTFAPADAVPVDAADRDTLVGSAGVADGATLVGSAGVADADFPGHCIGPVHLSELPWEQPRTPGFPIGSGRKTLRLDDESGEGFWVLGLLPHWESALREWHEFAEENYVLAGEIETAVGVMTAGAYLAHPAGREFIHGPMRSRTGALIITRSSGPFATTYEPAPEGFTLPGPWP